MFGRSSAGDHPSPGQPPCNRAIVHVQLKAVEAPPVNINQQLAAVHLQPLRDARAEDNSGRTLRRRLQGADVTVNPKPINPTATAAAGEKKQQLQISD